MAGAAVRVDHYKRGKRQSLGGPEGPRTGDWRLLALSLREC